MSGRLTVPGVAATAVLSLAGCGCGSSKTAGHAATSRAAPFRSAATQSASRSATLGTEGFVVGSAGGVRAAMRPASHHPRGERPWPISFTVTRGGRPARASVTYEFLFGGQVVARRSHYTFTGHFADVFKWPGSAVGYPLTFRAAIASGGTTLNLDYPVQVTR